MENILGATTSLFNKAKTVVTTSVASSVSKAKDALSSITGSATTGAPLGIPLPIKNPLHAYSTYNYVISLGVLKKNEVSDPDGTYMQGNPIEIVCKSGNADPLHLVKTNYGTFNYYIDNLTTEGTMGLKQSTTNVTLITFDIVEPYSMGMFMQSLQIAAGNAGWANFQNACYLLTVEFRGNTDSGTSSTVANSTFRIPIKITTVTSKITESGTVYTVSAFNWGSQALANKFSTLKSFTSISGKTVQEMLQTGEKSLQAVVNARLAEVKTLAGVPKPDQILILFPTEIASATNQSVISGNKEIKSSATTSTTQQPGSTQNKLFIKLGVVEQGPSKTLVQNPELCNEIGKSSLGFGDTRAADSPFGKDNKVYNVELGTIIRANNTADTSTSDFRFAQKQDIVTVIENVILQSDYCTKQLNNKLPPDGYRTWFRIETQTYVLDTPENLTKTGEYPRLYVYRVVPYRVHASRFMSVNVQAPGLDLLNKNVVKEYNYVYTGKNTDILNFEMDLYTGFQQMLASDNFQQSQDVVRSSSTANSIDKNSKQQFKLNDGQAPNPSSNQAANSVVYSALDTSSDRKGGGGAETIATRTARMFHDILLYGYDHQILNMEIIGDPYFINQSGQGNYTSKVTQCPFLNEDGTIAWQTTEPVIRVNFRTPIDLNQTTGLYDFGPNTSTAPVNMFSGLYVVNTISSKFKDGKFTQTLQGFRLPNQDLTKPSTVANTADKTYNSAEPIPVSATNQRINVTPPTSK